MTTSTSQSPCRSAATRQATGNGTRASAVMSGPATRPRKNSRRPATAPSPSHLSCWRPSGPAVHQRTTSDARDVATAASATTSWTTPAAGDVTQSTPTGLTTPARRRGGDQLPYGVKAHATVTSTTASTASTSAGRHRRDGSRPSGSTSGTTVPTVTRAVDQAQLANQNAETGSTPPPPRPRAWTPYSSAADDVARTAPIAARSPPMGRRGRARANHSPAPPNATPPTTGMTHQSVTPGASGLPAFAACSATPVARAPARTRPATATAASTRRVVARGARRITALEVTPPWSAIRPFPSRDSTSRPGGTPRPDPDATTGPCRRDAAGPSLVPGEAGRPPPDQAPRSEQELPMSSPISTP